nr:hypothetical protein [bacterium]
LTETGNNTGKYRGYFCFKSFTDDNQDFIKAINQGDTIVVSIIDKSSGYKFSDTVSIQSTYLYIDEIIYAHPQSKTINSKTIVFTGLIGDPSMTNILYIYNSESGNTTVIGTFVSQTSFSYTVNFSSGGYKTLVFTASTLNDVMSKNSRTFQLNVDLTPPVLSIISPFNGQIFSQKNITVTGRFEHNNGLDTAYISVNGKDTFQIITDSVDTYLFVSQINISGAAAGDTIKIVASDFIGNSNFKNIIVYYKQGNITSSIIDPSSQNIVIPNNYDITNITLSPLNSSEIPETAFITILGADNSTITLDIEFNNPSAPVTLTISNSNYADLLNEIQVAGTNNAKLFGNSEDYEAGLKTMREFSFTSNGQPFNDAANFKNIVISYNLPDRFKGTFASGIFTFNKTLNNWEKLDESITSRGTNGDTISAELSHFSIYAVFLSSNPIQKDLSSVIVYPNPFRPNDNNSMTGTEYSPTIINSGVHISGLTGGNEIEIYTLTGERAAKFATGAGQAKIVWDAKNSDGKKLASGLYLILIKDKNGNKTVKKFTIIR